MNGLLDSHWYVHESGYEIYTPEPIELNGEVVCFGDVRAIDPKSRINTYRFEDYPGMFNELAMIIDKNNIKYESDFRARGNNDLLSFVNKYGLLSFENGYIQSLSDFYEHIIMIETLISIYKNINENKIDILNGIFSKQNDKWFIGDADLTLDLYGNKDPVNAYEFAHHFLCDLISKRIEDAVTVKLLVNNFNCGFDIIFVPKDLHGALYLQLAQVVSRNLEFKQCAACSTFFEVKSNKRKNEKIYCSDRCRVRVGARKRRDKEKAK